MILTSPLRLRLKTSTGGDDVANGYINNFKGRRNRTEKAKHLRDEFDAIAAGFVYFQEQSRSTYTTIYTNTIVSETTYLIDPANGVLQEITLTQDTTIMVGVPQAEDSRQLSLLVHGSGITVTNGWGPQTWKEGGSGDWTDLLTGAGQYASMLLEFTWDGAAWICIAASSFTTAEQSFPFVKDLVSVSGVETLGFVRSGSATTFDTNERAWVLPDGEPRFIGSRYVHNWVATPSDLQSEAWEEDYAVVTTDAGAGPSGGNVDRITFSATGGEVACWVLPNFGRASVDAEAIKFAVRFKAKMATVASGSFRVAMSLHGATTGLAVPVHDVITVNVTDAWDDYGHVFDFITGQDLNSMNIASSTAQRVLTQLAFISPSGSTGDPVQVTDVQIEILREDYPEVPSETQDGTIGASITLAATAASTGTWDNGTKIMTLDSQEMVDFSDSLEIGKTYLMVCRVTSGFSADVFMDDDRRFWQAYSNATETMFIKDAPFVFRYEGGGVKWKLIGGASGAYVVNIYECSGNQSVYDTEIGNTLNPTTKILTEATGVPVSSAFVEGLAVETVPVENLIDVDEYRSFYNWTRVGLTSLSDSQGRVSSYRGEYGIDGMQGKGTLLQDARTTSAGYITLTKTIPADTNEYTFAFFTRKLFDALGDQQIFPERTDHLTTPASERIDVIFTLKNGSSSIGGERIRINVITGGMVPWYTATDYNKALAINYTNWWRHGLSLVNDGTMTSLEIRIYPAANDVGGTAVDASVQGYAIIDWAQAEEELGTFTGSGLVVGGETRGAESLTTALADGDLYNSLSEVIGDVTGGAFQFDQTDTIVKNITWGSESLAAFSADNLHEFGPQVLACVDTLDDDLGDQILDANGNNICTTGMPTSIQLLTDAPNLIVWYDFQGTDPTVITPYDANVVDLTEYDLLPDSATPTLANLTAARRTSMAQAFTSYKTSAGTGHGFRETTGGGHTIDPIYHQVSADYTDKITVFFTFAASYSTNLTQALWHARQTWTLQGFSSYYTNASGGQIEVVVFPSGGAQVGQRVTDTAVLDGELHVVAFRVDGADFDLWFDGAKNVTKTLAGSVGLLKHWPLEWASYGSWTGYDADLQTTDLFVAYGGALTDTEIEDICNAIVSEII